MGSNDMTATRTTGRILFLLRADRTNRRSTTRRHSPESIKAECSFLDTAPPRRASATGSSRVALQQRAAKRACRARPGMTRNGSTPRRVVGRRSCGLRAELVSQPLAGQTSSASSTTGLHARTPRGRTASGRTAKSARVRILQSTTGSKGSRAPLTFRFAARPSTSGCGPDADVGHLALAALRESAGA